MLRSGDSNRRMASKREATPDSSLSDQGRQVCTICVDTHCHSTHRAVDRNVGDRTSAPSMRSTSRPRRDLSPRGMRLNAFSESSLRNDWMSSWSRSRSRVGPSCDSNFGLHDGYTYHGEEIGRIMRCTRERVHALLASALAQLRHPRRAKRLKCYIRDLCD